MPDKRTCCRCDLEKEVSQFDPVPYTKILKTTCRSCTKEMIEILKKVPGRKPKTGITKEPVPDPVPKIRGSALGIDQWNEDA